MSLTGTTVAHYRILEEISRGGMGVVYRATDTRLHRDVALKVLPAELVADPDRRERFVREARAASALEHPHIAVIHDIGEANGVSFIAMELVRGDKLSTVLERRALPPARALDLAAEVAEGLARAHAQGIIHRDLKPANVMLTDDGHAKVIDFGLAKLMAPLSGDTSAETLPGAAGTAPNVVMGTVAYMSPEQGRGAPIDPRSDIFSLGVMLYEMLAGTPPFRGVSTVDTLHAILHDPAPPLPRLNTAAGPSTSADIQRILDKCLAKDPADRYQGMKDLVVDLRAARRRLDSSADSLPPTPAASPARRLSRAWLVAAAVVTVAAIGGVVRWNQRDRGPLAEASGSRPSVAVLYFENNTGDAGMDWMRTGLTDMLVTDLSQSTAIEVLGTDRLVQILTQMRRQDDKAVSFDVVQELARRAGVRTVLLGSYVKAGEAIRINLKLQEAATGRIITAERVDAASEAGLFPTMDELTRRVKAKFAESMPGMPGGLVAKPGSAPVPPPTLDRDLKDVTTSSAEAYRYYAQGIDLHQRGRSIDALPLMQKAVSIDPDFALAFAKMAVLYGNLLQSNQRDEYAKKALDRVNRLSPRERYYIEGYYYSTRPATVGKAIESYNRLLELYPDHSASRNNLGVLYLQSNRPDEAIRQFQILEERGFEFPSSAGALASALMAAGRSDEAVATMQRFVNRFPAGEAGYGLLGAALVAAERLDEASAAFDKSLALAPSNMPALRGQATVALLREDWDEAARVAALMEQSPVPLYRAVAVRVLVLCDLYRGRSRAAIDRLERQVAAMPAGAAETVAMRNLAANVRLARGQPAEALAQMSRAMDEAPGRVGFETLILAGLAQAHLKRPAELAKARTALADALRVAEVEGEVPMPYAMDGGAALAMGDAAGAVAALTKAESLLAPGPIGISSIVFQVQPRAQIWYWLGLAHLDRGRDAEAAEQFRRVAERRFFHLSLPVEHVRSLYFLGQIAERQGDRAKAREYYARFVGYWKDGDLDRDRVQEALKTLGGS